MNAPWTSPVGSFSLVVTPPTEEPLTLADGKLRAGLDWADTDPPDPRDALMRDFIAAARVQVERDTGLALLTQTRDVYFSLVSGGLVALPGQALPLQEVIEVWPVDEWPGLPGAEVPVRSGPARAARDARLVTQGGVTHLATSALDGLTAAVARCVVGWKNRETLKAEQPLLVHAVGLLTAHFATTGRDPVISGTIAQMNPIGYDDAIASYRLVWVI